MYVQGMRVFKTSSRMHRNELLTHSTYPGSPAPQCRSILGLNSRRTGLQCYSGLVQADRGRSSVLLQCRLCMGSIGMPECLQAAAQQ